MNSTNVALIVFDVDGTLCDTSAVDEDCYLRAAGEVLGTDVRGTDWTAAPQFTDAAILDWLWKRLRGRAPSAEELTAVRERFVALLREELRRAPEGFRAIAGAPELVARLMRERRAAAATGGWRDSARLKLEAAGIPPDLLLASSNDASDRAEIFRLAFERAKARGAVDGPVVLVGDGLWDIEVARRLGWGFVGIAAGGDAERLRAAGASEIISDYGDAATFASAVERAVLKSRVMA